jgi:hypothetical protein
VPHAPAHPHQTERRSHTLGMKKGPRGRNGSREEDLGDLASHGFARGNRSYLPFSFRTGTTRAAGAEQSPGPCQLHSDEYSTL